MINETFRKLEARINEAPAMQGENKKELLSLLGELEREISELAVARPEEAKRLAGYSERSVEHAMDEGGTPESLKHALNGLNDTVTEFEKDHPSLVQSVNRFCLVLSNMGI